MTDLNNTKYIIGFCDNMSSIVIGESQSIATPVTILIIQPIVYFGFKNLPKRIITNIQGAASNIFDITFYDGEKNITFRNYCNVQEHSVTAYADNSIRWNTITDLENFSIFLPKIGNGIESITYDTSSQVWLSYTDGTTDYSCNNYNEYSKAIENTAADLERDIDVFHILQTKIQSTTTSAKIEKKSGVYMYGFKIDDINELFTVNSIEYSIKKCSIKRNFNAKCFNTFLSVADNNYVFDGNFSRIIKE